MQNIKIYNMSLINLILTSPENVNIFVKNKNVILKSEVDNVSHKIGETKLNIIKKWFYGSNKTITISGT
jgi:hypothetical protein